MEGRRRNRGRRLLTVRTYLLYSDGNSSLSRYGMAWHGGRRSGVDALFEDRCLGPLTAGRPHIEGGTRSVTLPPVIAAQCCACLSPTPTFQPITIPIRLNLDPISSRICSASAVEHPDPQLLTPSQDITPSGLADFQLSRIFPTPPWVPHQKKASEKRKGKKEPSTTTPSQAKTQSVRILHGLFSFFIFNISSSLNKSPESTESSFSWRFSLPRVPFLAHTSIHTHRYFPRATPSVDSHPRSATPKNTTAQPRKEVREAR